VTTNFDLKLLELPPLSSPGGQFPWITGGFFSPSAQLIDGALGLAYGVLSNAALLAIGLPPAHASALVHTAEIFTTSASATSHIYHRNVDWRMVARLGVPGVLGAILGAWILTNIDVTAARR